jgi:hypothetical protein
MKSKLLFSLLSALAIFLVFANCSDPKTTPPGCTEEEGCEGGNSSSGGNSVGNIGANATLAGNINDGRVREMYNSWINTYYVTYEDDELRGNATKADAPGTARIKAAYTNSTGTHTNGSRTCSEAVGYGMILTSLMKDWPRFDKLLAYSKLYYYTATNINSSLMRWDIGGFSNAIGGPATDADIDILASLIIAHRETGEQRYLDDAIAIGKSLYDYAIGDTRLLLPAVNGDGLFKGATPAVNFYNISYMSLAAIKALADYDKGSGRDWNAVLEASISYMEKVQNAGAGLWPDWSDAGGVPINPCNGSNRCLSKDYPGSAYDPVDKGRCDATGRECAAGVLNTYESYFQETPRIPWRIAWYYHWYGDPRAKAMLDKGMSFLQNKGISGSNLRSIREFYNYYDNNSKDKEGSGSQNRIIFSLCALGMGSDTNKEWLNSCNTMATDTYNPSLATYYASSLQLIYAMLFSGKF